MVSELKFRLYRAQEAAHETAGEGRRTDSGRTRDNYRRTGIDPGVIWFLGTVGCRHRCLLSYHDYRVSGNRFHRLQQHLLLKSVKLQAKEKAMESRVEEAVPTLMQHYKVVRCSKNAPAL